MIKNTYNNYSHEDHSKLINKTFLFSFVVGSIPCTVVLLWWFMYDPTAKIGLRTPGMDKTPNNVIASPERSEKVTIGEFFSLFSDKIVPIKGAWPRFRGKNFTNINTEKVKLQSSLANHPPRLLWSIELGEGHAAPAIAHSRVYVLDYDEKENADALRCFSLAEGIELWRRWYKVKVKRNHGRSRTIPAVTDSFALTLGPRGHVMCVNPFSGDLLWSLDLVSEFSSEIPLWYTGQCPLIDDTVAVLAPGGTSLMIGVDCRNGKIIWQAPNPQSWKMSHSSIMPMFLGGRKIYLYFALGGIVGVAGDGEDRGRILFSSDAFKPNVIAPSPVVLDQGRIFASAGYGAGSRLFQVTVENDSFTITPQQLIPVKQGLSSEQQTPIYFQDHLFGVLPTNAGQGKNEFTCFSLTDLNTMLWSSGPQFRFGLGPFLLADEKFFILSDLGQLTVAQATPNKFVVLSSIKLIDGIDTWGPMALVSGRLIIRDANRMFCFDIRDKKTLNTKQNQG